jgi:hypothetical protein
MVCALKCYGGLGILDLRIVGLALRLRWEWQKRAADAPPWTRLPARPEKMVEAMFCCSVSVELGNGASARFWTDSWLPTGQIKSFVPHLFQAVGKWFWNVSVRDALF